MPDPLIAEFHKVLNAERQALISAQFDLLPGFYTQKEGFLTRLVQSNPHKAELRLIKASMDENQALLAAAMKGVAAARERLEALHNVQNGLSVYTDEGRVELAQRRMRTLEKKA